MGLKGSPASPRTGPSNPRSEIAGHLQSQPFTWPIRAYPRNPRDNSDPVVSLPRRQPVAERALEEAEDEDPECMEMK